MKNIFFFATKWQNWIQNWVLTWRISIILWKFLKDFFQRFSLKKNFTTFKAYLQNGIFLLKRRWKDTHNERVKTFMKDWFLFHSKEFLINDVLFIAEAQRILINVYTDRIDWWTLNQLTWENSFAKCFC